MVQMKWLISGGILAIASIASYKLLKSTKKAELDVIYILPDDLLLDIFHQTKKRISKTYRRAQNNFRKHRRQFIRRSEPY